MLTYPLIRVACWQPRTFAPLLFIGILMPYPTSARPRPARITMPIEPPDPV